MAPGSPTRETRRGTKMDDFLIRNIRIADGLGAGSGYPAHPRAYANQVKVFSDFVREKHLVSLEEAVRKSTSLPADFLGIKKGHIKEGYDADIVIFDPETIGSDATLEKDRSWISSMTS